MDCCDDRCRRYRGREPDQRSLLYGFILPIHFWCEITISLPFREEFMSGRSVFLGIVRLKHDLLIVIETEPLKPFDNRSRRFLG